MYSVFSRQCALRLTDHYALLTRELVLRKITGMNLTFWSKNPAITKKLGVPATAMMALSIGREIESDEFRDLETLAPYPPTSKRSSKKPATDALNWASEYMEHFSIDRIQRGIKKRVANTSSMRARLKKALTAVGVPWVDRSSP